MSYITNADDGCGLIRYGSSLAFFVNRFPKNTKLYKLINTKRVNNLQKCTKNIDFFVQKC